MAVYRPFSGPAFPLAHARNMTAGVFSQGPLRWVAIVAPCHAINNSNKWVDSIPETKVADDIIEP